MDTVLGENWELRADLNSEYRDKRKDAIKRVIANMTVGKDVSGLFPDVLKNMQTEDLEQKKLVYLYLMNYAKTQPELVILAVNTFVKVSSHISTGTFRKAKVTRRVSGLGRSESPGSSIGYTDDGRVTCRQDH